MGVAIQYRTFYFNFYHDFNEGIKLFRGMLTKIEHFYRLYDSDFPPVVPIKNTFLYVLIFEIWPSIEWSMLFNKTFLYSKAPFVGTGFFLF